MTEFIKYFWGTTDMADMTLWSIIFIMRTGIVIPARASGATNTHAKSKSEELYSSKENVWG
ncbi:hypothetical protein [Streptococcus ruminantium]|uniref:hypothetical protein n=1 Tax=Streptococcus ruminantium TaxID=1917441 RepID=UPI000465BF82|nr:hypothetical protein [Streptococcus ruminantium]